MRKTRCVVSQPFLLRAQQGKLSVVLVVERHQSKQDTVQIWQDILSSYLPGHLDQLQHSHQEHVASMEEGRVLLCDHVGSTLEHKSQHRGAKGLPYFPLSRKVSTVRSMLVLQPRRHLVLAQGTDCNSAPPAPSCCHFFIWIIPNGNTSF